MLPNKEHIEYFRITIINVMYQHAFNLSVVPTEKSAEQADVLFSDLVCKPDIDTPLDAFFQTLDQLKTHLFQPTEQETQKALLEKLKSDLYPNVLCFLDEQSSALSLSNSLADNFINAFSSWLTHFQKESPALEKHILEVRLSPTEPYRSEQARIRQANAQSQLHEAQRAKRAFTKFQAIVKKHLSSQHDFPKETQERLLSFAPLFQQYFTQPWLRIKCIDDMSKARWQDIMLYADKIFDAIENDIVHANLTIQHCEQLRESALSNIKITPSTPTGQYHHFHSQLSLDFKEAHSTSQLRSEACLLSTQMSSSEDGLVLLQKFITLLQKHLQKQLKSNTSKQQALFEFYIQQLHTLLPEYSAPYIRQLNDASSSEDTTYEELFKILETLPIKIEDNIAKDKKKAVVLQKMIEQTLYQAVSSTKSVPDHPSLIKIHAIDDEMRALYSSSSSHFDIRGSECAHLYHVYSLTYKANILLARALTTQQYTLFIEAKQCYDAALIALGRQDETHLPVITSNILALKSLFEENCPYLHHTPIKPVSSPLMLSSTLSSAFMHSPKLASILEQFKLHKRRLNFPVTKDKDGILHTLLNTLYPQLLHAICDIERENEIIPGQLLSIVYDALIQQHQHLITQFSTRQTTQDHLMHFYSALSQVKKEMTLKSQAQKPQARDFALSNRALLDYLDLPLINPNDFTLINQLDTLLSTSPQQLKDIKSTYLNALKILQTYDPKYHPQYLRVDTKQRLITLSTTVKFIKTRLAEEHAYIKKQLISIDKMQQSTKAQCITHLSTLFLKTIDKEKKQLRNELRYLHDDLLTHLTHHIGKSQTRILERSLSEERPSVSIKQTIESETSLYLKQYYPFYHYLDNTMKSLNIKLLSCDRPEHSIDKEHCLKLLKLIQTDTLSPEERKLRVETQLSQPDHIGLLEKKAQTSQLGAGSLLSRLGMLRDRQQGSHELNPTAEVSLTH